MKSSTFRSFFTRPNLFVHGEPLVHNAKGLGIDIYYSPPLLVPEMGDPSKSRTETTPSWQQASKADDPQELRASKDPSVHNNTDAEGSEDELLEQASKFLEHDEIKDASNERKIEYLKKKGLATERIHKLLGDLRDSSVEKTGSKTSSKEEALVCDVSSEHQLLY